MDIKELLHNYQKNMDEIRMLDNHITNTNDKAFWKNAMLNRASRLHELYDENNKILDAINIFDLEKYNDPNGLYLEVKKMYYDNFDDSLVLIPMLNKFISFVESLPKNKDTISCLLFLYSAMAYESTEYVSRVSGEKNEASLYHYKIYDLEKDICMVTDVETIGLYILNYYNHLNAISDKLEYIEETYKLYERFIDLVYNKKAFDSVKNEPYIKDLIHSAETTWLVADDVIEGASAEIKKSFYDSARKYYNSELKNNNNDMTKLDGQVYISYLHSQAMFNDISYEEAINCFLDYYFEKKKTIKLDENITDDDFYFLVNGPISLEKLLSHVDNRKRTFVMDRLNIVVENTWGKILKAKKETPFVNNILAIWCSTTLKYCKSLQQKESKLLDLIVKRQLTTYIHSYMVKTIALAIFESMYNTNSDLFADLNMEYEELSDYVSKAAMLHDIGKTKICDIVTMVRRRLSDYEFRGIKNHPDYGADVIGHDKDLAIYTDVIRGHHKWYNGKGGYPDTFDNTKSKYRIIIDIITLADCLDAATDYLGRNYKYAKDVNAVLKEFEKEKGIKYNPEIVDIIINDERLVAELDRLTKTDRLDVMYMACED